MDDAIKTNCREQDSTPDADAAASPPWQQVLPEVWGSRRDELDEAQSAAALGLSAAVWQDLRVASRIPAAIPSRSPLRFRRIDLLRWALAGAGGDVKAETTAAGALLLGGVYRHKAEYASPDAALEGCVRALGMPDEADRDVLLRAVLDREHKMSTAMGQGTAWPHGRIPAMGGHVCLAVNQLAKPVDFGHHDGMPVAVLALVLFGLGGRQIRVQAAVGRSMNRQRLQACLRAGGGLDAVLPLLERRCEEDVAPAPADTGWEATICPAQDMKGIHGRTAALLGPLLRNLNARLWFCRNGHVAEVDLEFPSTSILGAAERLDLQAGAEFVIRCSGLDAAIARQRLEEFFVRGPLAGSMFSAGTRRTPD